MNRWDGPGGLRSSASSPACGRCNDDGAPEFLLVGRSVHHLFSSFCYCQVTKSAVWRLSEKRQKHIVLHASQVHSVHSPHVLFLPVAVVGHEERVAAFLGKRLHTLLHVDETVRI